MTTKYRLTSLSAENCAFEIHSKMQGLSSFQLETYGLSTLFHQKTKQQQQQQQQQKNTAKKNNRKNTCFFYISRLVTASQFDALMGRGKILIVSFFFDLHPCAVDFEPVFFLAILIKIGMDIANAPATNPTPL